MKGLCDLHCHIIPGVDDGAKDLDEALTLLKMQYDEGVRNIIVTPHYRIGMFEEPMKKVLQNYLKIKSAAKEIGRDGISLYLGCEVYMSREVLDVLKRNDRPTMAGTRYVLTEYSSSSSLKEIRDYVYLMISSGYIPIIAHVERYREIREDTEGISQLKNLGAKIQVNAGSIIGRSGWRVKRACKRLMCEDLIDFVASDCHDIKHRVPNLGKCALYIEKKMGSEYVKRILIENPAKIIK